MRNSFKMNAIFFQFDGGVGERVGIEEAQSGASGEGNEGGTD